jgi:hypothetical protein
MHKTPDGPVPTGSERKHWRDLTDSGDRWLPEGFREGRHKTVVGVIRTSLEEPRCFVDDSLILTSSRSQRSGLKNSRLRIVSKQGYEQVIFLLCKWICDCNPVPSESFL